MTAATRAKPVDEALFVQEEAYADDVDNVIVSDRREDRSDDPAMSDPRTRRAKAIRIAMQLKRAVQ